jgi:acetyl esterase/lipase
VAAGTPCVDDLSRYKTAKESPYKSMQEMEFAPTLNWAKLKWFDDLKWSSLSKESGAWKKQMADVKWFADLMTAPSFKNLGKTLIYTAECDPLRDEGEAYGRKLVEDGNEVTTKRFEGVPHAFMHMDAGRTFSFFRSLYRKSFDSSLTRFLLALPQARHYIEMLSEAIRNSLVVEV